MAKTVVIIDDDPDDLDFLKEAIFELDPTIQCLSFIYSEEAVRLLSSGSMELPDYIFVDINMPRKMGNECLSDLRRVTALAGVPIIMYSTHMPLNVQVTLKKAGANFAFQKPVSILDYKPILKTIFSN